MKYNPQHYLDCAELESLLHDFQKEFPDFVDLEEIGRTHEGRAIRLVTLTHKKTGPPLTKPGYWIDGNTHATELASAQACVHILHHLLSLKDTTPEYKRLLDEQVLYVVPRICPDGAELALKTPMAVRSTPFLWPHAELLPGLYPEDIDSDGQILTIRIPDPSGPWRVSEKDPRILRLRKPDEPNDPSVPTFKLVLEGKIHHGNTSSPISAKELPPRTPFGIDMNRQYPQEWAPEGKQFGAGPATLSQPESRAVFNAICQRPNIVGAVSFHTFSRVLIRPWTNHPDDTLPYSDLETWKTIGGRAEELTGYPAVSGFHGFKYHPRERLYGDFGDWAYAQRGIYAWTAEIWHLAQAAGIEIKNHIDWFFSATTEEDMIRIFEWCDKELPKDSYFQNWKPFEHPDFGPVEIGGWKTKFTWSNPPAHLLQSELDRMVKLVLFGMKINPRVELRETTLEKVSTAHADLPLTKVGVLIENTGFLPTYGSEQALTTGSTAKPRVSVRISGNLKIVSGKPDFETEHLLGRANLGIFKSPLISALMQLSPANHHQSRYEWILSGKGLLEMKFQFERAGTFTHKVEI